MNLDTLIFFDTLWIRFILGFIVGAALGSFAGVVIYRFPRGLSIVRPRSHCLSCNTVLGVRDLVPIISWLTTRGHCRYCHAKIGAQSLVIETAIGFVCAIVSIAI
ncbi:MAG: prepilin peptidase [Bdellovibrionales bacterium]